MARPRADWPARARWTTGTAVLALAALCWLWLWHAPMPMPGAAPLLSAGYLALSFAMWAVMMIAMMAPSVLPAVALFALAERQQARVIAFLAGYLVAWIVYAAAATALQTALIGGGLIDLMGVSVVPWFSAGLWLAVAAWQVLPIKRACLTQCRTPAAFLAAHFRPGVGGALRTGFEHGLYCVGCCWALMLLLFVGGVMDLRWVAALTLAVLAEKCGPWPRVTRFAIAIVSLAAAADALVPDGVRP